MLAVLALTRSYTSVLCTCTRHNHKDLAIQLALQIQLQPASPSSSVLSPVQSTACTYICTCITLTVYMYERLPLKTNVAGGKNTSEYEHYNLVVVLYYRDPAANHMDIHHRWKKRMNICKQALSDWEVK